MPARAYIERVYVLDSFVRRFLDASSVADPECFDTQ